MYVKRKKVKMESSDVDFSLLLSFEFAIVWDTTHTKESSKSSFFFCIV